MNDIDLTGVIDLHIHTAPDVRPRKMNDIECAQAARDAGIEAVLLKSHHTLTSDRARIAELSVSGIRVFGGLALNDAVGGLNPAAVETALVMGAKEIWMPTLSAANQQRYNHSLTPGISILDKNGTLQSEAYTILELIASHDAILGTGHLSVHEIIILVEAAREMKVKRILVTHPELPVVNMPIEIQEEISGTDLYFERCLISVVAYPTVVSIANIAQMIHRVGIESTILATDFGQMDNPTPIEGIRFFISNMKQAGFSQKDLDLMTRENPKKLLEPL